MGWEMHHGPRLWSKNCAVTKTEKYYRKAAQQTAKRAAQPSGERGGGWLGWGNLEINTGLRLFGQWPVDCKFWRKFLCFPPFFERNKKKSTILPVSCLFLPTHSPNVS